MIEARLIRRHHRLPVLLALLVSVGCCLTGKALAATPATDGSSAVTHITDVGFQRGQHGQGLLVIRHEGKAPNAHLFRGNGFIRVRLPHAGLPPGQTRKLDVRAFATPVDSIAITTAGDAVTFVLDVHGQTNARLREGNGKLVVAVATSGRPVQAATASRKHRDGQTERVSFNFQDIPVRAALQLIAQASHLNLVAADSVDGNITLHLDNVPWSRALDVILRAKGLAKRRDGNVVWIAPQDALATYEQHAVRARIKASHGAPLQFAYIPISYGKAKDIAKLLSRQSRGKSKDDAGVDGQGGFLSPRGSVTYDARTNTLLINDTASKIAQIRHLVSVLDRPVKQVLIEARIVAATDSFAHELGVRWGMSRWARSGNELIATAASSVAARGLLADGGVGAAGLLNTGGYNVNLPVPNPAGSLALAILGSNYLIDLELEAAQTEGRTEIISSPRVITANQQQAVIKQGQEIGYVTYEGGTEDSNGTANVQFKDAVLQLKVTPTITRDGRVFLEIHLVKDALNRFILNPGGGQVPLIDTRAINTSVLVKDGETVVLGGIYEMSKRNSVRKVPGLGDLPIIGALFRSTEHSNEKAELLVFVTPRILDDPNDQPDIKPMMSHSPAFLPNDPMGNANGGIPE